MKGMNFAMTLLCGTGLVSTALLGTAAQSQPLMPVEELGRSIFFDENLSLEGNQACAACHGPEVGFTGPLSEINVHGGVYEGSVPGRFGDRKPPSAAYATTSPIFHQDKHGLFVGGNFWDGRATGEVLGNPAADQALGPFLNPVEQALSDEACVVYRVCNPAVPGDYPVSFDDVWPGACDIAWPVATDSICESEGTMVPLSAEDRSRVDESYGNVGLSIAAFEDSPEVNAFTSKYDLAFEGVAKLSKEEQRGFALFQGKGKCRSCHPGSGKQALFTDFTFDNLGIPQNPDNPAGVAPAFVDPGLGGFLQNSGYPEDVYLAEWGKHKVPTLRNVGKGSCEADSADPDCIVKSYGHNGYFKSLAETVHFYNTRDVLARCEEIGDPEPGVNCWPEPEVAMNVNTDELGDLGLTAGEEAALIAFLMTLSDGHQP